MSSLNTSDCPDLEHFEFIRELVENGGKCPPGQSGVETHPYLRFRHQMVARPKLYIVGTFPPASYLLQQLNLEEIEHMGIAVRKQPRHHFFHGAASPIWEYLMDDLDWYADDEDVIERILAWLAEREIVYTDIARCVRREMLTRSSDGNFAELWINRALMNELLDEAGDSTAPINIWFTNSACFNKVGVRVNQTGPQLGRICINGNSAHCIFLRALQMMNWDIELRVPGSENPDWCTLQDVDRLRSEFTQIDFHQIRIRKGDRLRSFNIHGSIGPGSKTNRQLSNNAVCAQWMRENDASGPEGLMKFWKSHYRGIVEKVMASDRGLS